MTRVSIELQTPPRESLDPSREESPESGSQALGAGEIPGDRQDFSLPPVDGGKDAWLFLTASFVLECLVWGA